MVDNKAKQKKMPIKCQGYDGTKCGTLYVGIKGTTYEEDKLVKNLNASYNIAVKYRQHIKLKIQKKLTKIQLQKEILTYFL